MVKVSIFFPSKSFVAISKMILCHNPNIKPTKYRIFWPKMSNTQRVNHYIHNLVIWAKLGKNIVLSLPTLYFISVSSFGPIPILLMTETSCLEKFSTVEPALQY